MSCQTDEDSASTLLQVLRASCAINDALLLEELTSSFAKGKLAVTLSYLREHVNHDITSSVLAEVQRGALQAIVMDGSQAKADLSSIETALLADAKVHENGDTRNDEHNCILLFPLFKHPTWALVDVLLQQCRQERMLVPLELLLEAIAVLMQKPGSMDKACVEESDMLLAITDAIFRSGLPDQRARLSVEQHGRIVVRPALYSTSKKSGNIDSKEDLNSPLPLYCKEEQALGLQGPAHPSTGGAAQLDRAIKGLQPHLRLVRAICGIPELGSLPCNDEGPAATGRWDRLPGVGIVLGLLGILRTLSEEGLVLGLPAACAGGVCGGALFWAFERATWGPTADPAENDAKLANDGKTQGNEEEMNLQNCPECFGSNEFGPSIPAHLIGAQYTSEGGLTEITETSCYSEGCSPAMTPTRCSADQAVENLRALCQAVRGQDATEAPSGQPEEQQRQEELKHEAQVLFIQCFRDDLLDGRQLLMSQINNFYKMRNNENSLRYKEAGYEKLHDFLLDIPGLMVYGSGNKMEIKLANVPAFEVFCQEICEGREAPDFQRPQPIPESFQWRIVEVFRRTGCREILARNFRDVWNYIFPNERLHCRDFGYRDVKGLLGNIPMLEKTGSKHNTGYALKTELFIAGPSERGAAGMPSPGLEPSGIQVPPVSLARGPVRPGMVTPGAAAMQQMAMTAAPTQMALPLLTPQDNVENPPQGMAPWHGPTRRAEQQSMPVPSWPLLAQAGAAFNGSMQVQPKVEVNLPGEVRDTEQWGLYPKVYDPRQQQQDMLPSKGDPIPGDARSPHPAGQHFEGLPSPEALGPGPPRSEQVMPMNWHEQQFPIPGFARAVMEQTDADNPDIVQQHNLTHAFPSNNGYDSSDDTTGTLEAGAQFYASLCQQLREPQLLPGSSSGALAVASPGSSSGMERSVSENMANTDCQPFIRRLPRKVYASDPVPVPSRGPLSTSPLAVGPYRSEPIPPPKQGSILASPASWRGLLAGSLPGHHSNWLPARRGEGPRVGVNTLPALGEEPPAMEMEAADEQPPDPPSEECSSTAGSVPTMGHPPGLEDVRIPQTAFHSEPIPAMTPAGHRMARKHAKVGAGLTNQAAFFSTPPKLGAESKYQSTFDMNAIFHSQLRNDRPRLHADFSSGRVLLSNSLCNTLFAPMCPLAQKDMVDLIHKDDRLSYSARAMHLSIGRCSDMEPLILRFLTAKGMRHGVLTGELVIGTRWCLDITLLDEASGS